MASKLVLLVREIAFSESFLTASIEVGTRLREYIALAKKHLTQE